MKERLEKLIEALNKKREGLLEDYLAVLEASAPDIHNGSQAAIDRAGFIHDVDKHITNLHMELRHLKAEKALKEVSHA